jgi:hypothetical protein
MGVEALACLLPEPQHPPDSWFDAAHRVGLGVGLELTAVRKVVRAAASLPRRGYMALRRIRGERALPASTRERAQVL